MGGLWGLSDGLRRPEGKNIRLRLNSILNGLTRRGPFMGNTLATLGEHVQYNHTCTNIGNVSIAAGKRL